MRNENVIYRIQRAKQLEFYNYLKKLFYINSVIHKFLYKFLERISHSETRKKKVHKHMFANDDPFHQLHVFSTYNP